MNHGTVTPGSVLGHTGRAVTLDGAAGSWRFGVTVKAYFEQENAVTLSHVVTACSEAQAVRAAFAHVGPRVRRGRPGKLEMQVVEILRR